MRDEQLILVESFQLPFLLSVPQLPEAPGRVRKWPLLLFLHGLMEGPPTGIQAGLTPHGPLRQGSSPLASSEFIVAAPQLPARGDIWRSYLDVVSQIVRHLQQEYGGDPARSYLTGF